MENLLQKLEKNWELCLLDGNLGKRTIKNKTKSYLKIIVCVSGGSDSVALIHLLHKLSKLLLLELNILHFNHKLRTESDQEQNFVKSIAEKFSIPFYYKKNNKFFNGQSGLQESARKWRLTESRNLLQKLRGDYIVTAHHADDQIETILLKILRGAHISNLQGMSWEKNQFVRPLLNCRKSELQDYLKKNNIKWMEDSSNRSPNYLRNRVRMELIPLLEKLTRGGLQSRIFDLSDQSKILRDWLNYKYYDWEKITNKKNNNEKDVLFISELKKAEKILQQEIIYSFIFENTGQSLSYRKLKKIFDLIYSDNDFWELHLSGKWGIYFSKDELRLKCFS